MNKYLITYDSSFGKGNVEKETESTIIVLHKAIKQQGYLYISGVNSKDQSPIEMLIPYHSIVWIQKIFE